MHSSRSITLVARALLIVQALLVFTGGIVRLTKSGLGCPTWPRCTPESLAPVEGQAEGALRAWIEFGNRLITVALVLLIVLLIALIMKGRRHDLKKLAYAQIAGVFAQIILGGITVHTNLNPISVASHFILSTILIAASHSLLIRSEGTRIENPQRSVAIQIHTALTFAVIVAGTFLTGAGPHSGDKDSVRLDIEIPTLAAIHGLLVLTLILYTVFLAYKKFDKYLLIFLAIAMAQGAIGYIQYLQAVPELLVAIHLIGSALVWIAAWRIRLTQFYTFTSRE